MKKEKYVILTRMLCDESLELKELGLYSTMLILKDNWSFTIKGLSQIVPASESKIKSILINLQNKGYISIKQLRTRQNRFDCNKVTFSCPENINTRVFISKEQYSYIFTILNTPTLPLEDRGMLLRLLFLNNVESLSLEGLSKTLPDGITRINSSIKRLLENGFLKKKKDSRTKKISYVIVGLNLEVKSQNKKRIKRRDNNFKLYKKSLNKRTLNEEDYKYLKQHLGVLTQYELEIAQEVYIQGYNIYEIFQTLREVRKSDFLQNKTDIWQCSAKWIANNIKKIIGGKYRTYNNYKNNIQKSEPIRKTSFINQRDYDFEELERQLSKANEKKLENYRKKIGNDTIENQPTENHANNKNIKTNINIKDDKNIDYPPNTYICNIQSTDNYNSFIKTSHMDSFFIHEKSKKLGKALQSVS